MLGIAAIERSSHPAPKAKKQYTELRDTLAAVDAEHFVNETTEPWRVRILYRVGGSWYPMVAAALVDKTTARRPARTS
jgi:hypothetical protein